MFSALNMDSGTPFFGPIIAIVSGFVLGFGLLKVYRFVRQFVPGRTVGTMGLLVAEMGLMGEAYQFTTQLVL